jgi:ABC-type phosphate/phosphonate transport system permease subunit
VAYIIVLILISVATIDTISRYLRLRLIGAAPR